MVPRLVTLSFFAVATTLSLGSSGEVIHSAPSRQRIGKSHTSATQHVSSRAVDANRKLTHGGGKWGVGGAAKFGLALTPCLASDAKPVAAHPNVHY